MRVTSICMLAAMAVVLAGAAFAQSSPAGSTPTGGSTGTDAGSSMSGPGVNGATGTGQGGSMMPKRAGGGASGGTGNSGAPASSNAQ